MTPSSKRNVAKKGPKVKSSFFLRYGNYTLFSTVQAPRTTSQSKQLLLHTTSKILIVNVDHTRQSRRAPSEKLPYRKTLYKIRKRTLLFKDTVDWQTRCQAYHFLKGQQKHTHTHTRARAHVHTHAHTHNTIYTHPHTQSTMYFIIAYPVDLTNQLPSWSSFPRLTSKTNTHTLSNSLSLSLCISLSKVPSHSLTYPSTKALSTPYLAKMLASNSKIFSNYSKCK